MNRMRNLKLIEHRNRYSDDSGRGKLSKPGTITITKPIDKSLVFAVCSGCGMKGAAYEDPNNPQQKKHYCIDCYRSKAI